MVRAGGFEFDLVEATTKIPFKEHSTKYGNVYIEAEPGAEYFVQVQKIAKTETNARLTFSVDGCKINTAVTYDKNSIDTDPYFVGILEDDGNFGVSHTSFMFVKPRMSDSSSVNRHLCMGKVEIQISSFVYTGRTLAPAKVSNSNFAAATVDMNQGGVAKKKNLRSDKGSKSFAKQGEQLDRNEITVGAHLDTITLNYCAALGLMEVGVLKKPEMWEYERMKNPAGPDSNRHAIQTEAGPDGVIDLQTGDDSDDEE